MKSTIMLLIVACTGLSLTASMTDHASAESQTAAPMAIPSLFEALSGLESGPELIVERRSKQLVVRDRQDDRVLMMVTPAGLAPAAHGVAPPAAGDKAQTTQRKGADGEVVYTESRSRLAARSLSIAPGQLGQYGLEILRFDNDDVHVSNSNGDLVFSTRTEEDGARIERAGVGFGCGCERRESASGVVSVRPL